MRGSLRIGALWAATICCGGKTLAAANNVKDAADDPTVSDVFTAPEESGSPSDAGMQSRQDAAVDATIAPDAASSHDSSVIESTDAPVDTGKVSDGPPLEIVDGGFSQNLGSDATVVVPTGGSSFGTYVGYFENYMFASGSDAVEMKLALGASDAGVSGVVILGSGTPPPPPTQPDLGYPDPSNGLVSVVEGFAYTILGGQLSGGRMKLGIDVREPWDEWCEIQTSYPQPGNSQNPFNCMPGGWCTESFSSAGGAYGTCGIQFCADGGKPGPRQPIDCAQASLCGLMGGTGICNCTATGCGIPPYPDILFDMQATPMHLDGSASGLLMVPGNVNVHLTEQ